MTEADLDHASDGTHGRVGTGSDLLATPSDPTDADDDTTTLATGRRRRPDWGLLIPCFVIGCALFAIIWGVTSAITGMDGIDRPDAVEDLSPVENAQQVGQQEQVMVDLQAGYEAVLVIDGIELETARIGEFDGDVTPGEQIAVPPTAVYDPGNARIEFRPSDDAVIQSFTEGRHMVQVIYWKTLEGRDDGARSYRWSFDVV